MDIPSSGEKITQHNAGSGICRVMRRAGDRGRDLLGRNVVVQRVVAEVLAIAEQRVPSRWTIATDEN